METATKTEVEQTVSGNGEEEETGRTTKEQEYEDLIKEIMTNGKARTFCSVCLLTRDVKGPPETPPGSVAVNDFCLFFKHEDVLSYAAEHQMNFPKDNYRDKKEQGARLACYKLYNKLEVGAVGRRPLPVCVEARIKLMNPSATYQGYKRKDDDSDNSSTGDGVNVDDTVKKSNNVVVVSDVSPDTKKARHT